ncbi:carbohydrate kinase family protein [Jiangella sp. DSM 45060]|uniref:carbohydrate kinase family protein n=1 Tax=Jiangella sp. DSM 45060 TaxID=1798224 RepID=UPI0008795D45|nr:PfkB family carbohydrate kinase [Jiangella sp. DSM 45060]SDS49929.1 ribokinase [Jiangella sp. DSM 45060]
MTPVIAVVGDIAVDYTIVTDHARAQDEKVPVASSTWELGGTAANVAAQIAKLGGRAALVGDVGTDPWGGWLLDRLGGLGVDTTAVRQLPGRSTVVTIVHDAARRTLYVDRGVTGQAPVPVDAAAGADLVYVNYAPEAVPALVEAGLAERTMLGLEHWMLDTPGLAACLPRLRAVVTNEAGLAELRRRRLRLGVDVVVTLGERGATLMRDDEIVHHEPAVPVTAVDPTGAGDAFAGALCQAVLGGRSLREAMASAVVAGALATQALGAQAAQPDAAQLAAHLR